MISIVFHSEGILGEFIKIRDASVHFEGGRVEAGLFQHGLDGGDVPVIDVAVGDHMHQLAHLQAGHLGHHVGQHRVLHHIPVVGGEHILAALVENGVQGVAGDVEGHRVGAGIQVHFVQVLEIVDIGQDAAGGGVVLQVIQHPIHLVEHALLVLVLDAQLVTVGLADGAVRSRPFVPDVAAQVADAVGLLLPDPQQFVHSCFPVGPAEGQDGELLLQIVAIDDAEFFNGVGGRAVLPVGTDVLVGVPDAVVKDLLNVLHKDLIGVAHDTFLPNFH